MTVKRAAGFSLVKVRLSIAGSVFLAMSTVAIVGTQLGPTPEAWAACNYNGSFYNARDFSTYPGGVDGTQAFFNVYTGVDPYVCNTEDEHTLESTGLYLKESITVPGFDYTEIGEDEGYIGAENETEYPHNGLYFFNYFQTLNVNGQSYLSVPQTSVIVGETHTNYAYIFVTCNPDCYLYAGFQTDSTPWTAVQLPDDEEPGIGILTNGEVLGDPLDTMGYATFSALQYYAGTWQYWLNKTPSSPLYPYCLADISGSGNQNWEFNNWGPVSTC